MRILKKMQLNQKTFHNLQSHLAGLHKCVYWLDLQSLNVWWRYNNSDMNCRQLCMKILKKRNKIKGPFITCSYIWHINTSKCVHWLDTHSVKVWWRYVLPNRNAVHFCDIIFKQSRVFPSCNKKKCVGNQIRPL